MIFEQYPREVLKRVTVHTVLIFSGNLDLKMPESLKHNQGRHQDVAEPGSLSGAVRSLDYGGMLR